jgi:rhodanese-related sulfurtransferase
MSFAQLPSVDIASLPSGAFLLDVREDDEWAAGHAEGALHVPMSDFAARYGEVAQALPEGGTAYVVCKAGGRSAQVTQYLVQQGVDAVNVDGGMLAWDGAGRPMVSENGGAAVVL